MEETKVELLLSMLAYNSNYPVVFEVKKDKNTEGRNYYRMFCLPIIEETYAETMLMLASKYPKYNELLMAIGVIDLKKEISPRQLHANVVKYLAANEIDYYADRKGENWFIKFPESIVQKNLEKYHQILEIGSSFINHFYAQNFLNRLRKTKEEKTKKLYKHNAIVTY